MKMFDWLKRRPGPVWIKGRCPVCHHRTVAVKLALNKGVKVWLCFNHEQPIRFEYETGRAIPIDWPGSCIEQAEYEK